MRPSAGTAATPRRLAMALRLLPLAGAAATLAAPASAQRVQGPGEDALVLPRGVFRMSVGGGYESFDKRYSSSAGGEATGDKLPLGAALSLADLGAAAVGGADALEARLRMLTGRNDLRLSFGASTLRAEANRVVVPIRMEMGLGGRLQLSAMVPYVRSRVSSDLRMNETGLTGDVGLNPARDGGEALTTNSAIVTSLQQGADELAAAIAGCGATRTGPVCGNLAAAQAAQASAAGAAADLAAIFGTAQVAGSPVVPLAGGTAATAVAARLAAIRTELLRFDVSAPAENAAPAAAAGPLTAAQFQRILADPEFGLQLEALRDVSRYGIGDVEVGATFQLWDSFRGDAARATDPQGPGLRASVGALVRLGTGTRDLAENALDIGTGDGQTDVELRAAADIFTGRRFWTTVAARWGRQLEDELEVRVPSFEGQVLVPAANLRTVQRDLGDYLVLDVSPRYAFSDFLAVGAHYSYRRKEEDAYTLTGEDPSSAPLALSALAFGSEGYEHRAGIGFALSTVRGFARGLVGVPIDVSYQHSRSIAGGGAQTSAATRDEVLIRVYLQPFGGR